MTYVALHYDVKDHISNRNSFMDIMVFKCVCLGFVLDFHTYSSSTALRNASMSLRQRYEKHVSPFFSENTHIRCSLSP